MMQIQELVLYGRNGKVRHLPFSLGTVNIIVVVKHFCNTCG